MNLCLFLAVELKASGDAHLEHLLHLKKRPRLLSADSPQVKRLTKAKTSSLEQEKYVKNGHVFGRPIGAESFDFTCDIAQRSIRH